MLDLFAELSPLFQAGILSILEYRPTFLANDIEDCLLCFLVVYSGCSYLIYHLFTHGNCEENNVYNVVTAILKLDIPNTVTAWVDNCILMLHIGSAKANTHMMEAYRI